MVHLIRKVSDYYRLCDNIRPEVIYMIGTRDKHNIASLASASFEQPSKSESFEHFAQSLAVLFEPPRKAPQPFPQSVAKHTVNVSAVVTKYSLGKGDGFPTQRRPVQRELSKAAMSDVEAWFQNSGIHIGIMADSPAWNGESHKYLSQTLGSRASMRRRLYSYQPLQTLLLHICSSSGL